MRKKFKKALITVISAINQKPHNKMLCEFRSAHSMKIFPYIFVLVVGIFIGLVAGFKYAPAEFVYWDAPNKASLHAHTLKALKSGKLENQIHYNEVSLNHELANHGKYLQSNLNWLLFLPELDGHAIKHASQYRMNNPYNEPDMSSPSNWNSDVDMNSGFVQDVIQSQTENNGLIKRVLEKYGAN